MELEFSYAGALLTSSNPHELSKAVARLEHIISQSTILRKEAMYLLCQTYYKMKHFELARTQAEELLRMDPDDDNARCC